MEERERVNPPPPGNIFRRFTAIIQWKKKYVSLVILQFYVRRLYTIFCWEASEIFCLEKEYPTQKSFV
jgi:hypothetical protein